MRAISKESKRIFSGRKPAMSSILILFSFLLVGCGNSKLELNSNWRDREITVDGKNTEWRGAMLFFEEDNVSVGLLNDENFFYICMIAEDQFIRAQVMRQGFTLWFDPEGGKEKTFGIKYPIGMQASGMPRGMRRDEQNLERSSEAPRRPMIELEILGPGKDELKKMPIAEAKGIDIHIEFSSGMLVYELKVPLIQSEQHPYAIGAEAGSSVGIGLETAKMEKQDVKGEMSGGRGSPTGGMRGEAGGRGMPGGRRPQMRKSLKIWAVVQLASNNSAVQE